MKNIKSLLLIFFITLFMAFVYYVTFNLAEPKVYDWMVKNITVNRLPFDKHKQIYGHDDIVLVVIDEQSINRYRWPWKRELYAKYFNYFNEYTQAKFILYDGIIATLDKDNPNSDKKLFDSLKRINNLAVGYMPTMNVWDNQDAEKKYDEEFTKKFGIDVVDKAPEILPTYRSFIPFPQEYFNSVKYTGSVSNIRGSINGDSFWGIDVTSRTMDYLYKQKGILYPSVSMRVFLAIHNSPQVIYTKQSIDIPELNYKIKQNMAYDRPTTPLRFYKINETEDYSHKKYSALDIIDSYDAIRNGKKPIINPEIFKDKIVVIGAFVPAGESLNDNKKTSVGNNHPGADIQATALDNLIHNDFMIVIPKWANILIMLIGMFGIWYIIKSTKISKSIIGIFLMLLGYFLLSSVFFYFKVVINVITPLTIFILTTVWGYQNMSLVENKNKEKVKSAMSKYMSDDVMKDVLKNIDNLGLGGKKANVTVLFADIRGFTSMSEKMTAQQVSEILNEYFSEMEPIITSHNGIINKFIGDAIMAVFGEPIQDENHAGNAVKSGFLMLEKVKSLHEKWEKEGKPKIEIGVGINTGEVFVGNIGSVNRMEYTVIGDTVNLASRLESYNKTYKTKMLISPSTYEFVKDIVQANEISDVEIRGKAEKINIYEIIEVKEN